MSSEIKKLFNARVISGFHPKHTIEEDSRRYWKTQPTDLYFSPRARSFEREEIFFTFKFQPSNSLSACVYALSSSERDDIVKLATTAARFFLSYLDAAAFSAAFRHHYRALDLINPTFFFHHFFNRRTMPKTIEFHRLTAMFGLLTLRPASLDSATTAIRVLWIRFCNAWVTPTFSPNTSSLINIRYRTILA